jgi:hypothetical protein
MPVAVSAGWSSTPVTTDPPRPAEHLEWQAAFTLRAAGPMRAAALLAHGGETQWVLQTHEPAAELELSAAFSPWRWRTSEAVQINFEGRRIRVTDAALKQDARDVASITAPQSARTGDVTSVLHLPGHAITLAFIAFAEDDTEIRRLGRWRVKPAAVAQLSEYLAPLASGYQTGTLVDQVH